MAQKELPITLEEQIDMMKKYVSFRQRIRMRRFLLHAGYFRASRYGKFLLSNVENVGYKSSQDALFALYQFDVDLRRILIYYCNRVEVRFKSAISNACAIKAQDGTFYIVRKEEKLRKNVVKYPELKEYRKGGNRHTNKLPIWVTFSYTEFGTMSMMYNYLRGDLRKGVLTYLFHEKRYSKGDTELVDTWLDGVRNLRNYCAHNSMVVGLKSSIVLRHQKDAENLLPKNNDLYSRLYALKKLLSVEDAKSMKKDLVKLIKKSSVDIYTLKILPEQWETLYDEISEF